MNKEFKSILVLGIIAIIISWIGLYQFKDVKFKNTKQLQKTNEEKIEKLTNEYSDLVDVYIPTITDAQQKNDLPTTWTIKVLFPWFLYNQWFDTISNNLKEENIRNSFLEFKNYNCKYKDCNHIDIDGCEILPIVGKDILESRYQNYKKIIKELYENSGKFFRKW